MPGDIDRKHARRILEYTWGETVAYGDQALVALQRAARKRSAETQARFERDVRDAMAVLENLKNALELAGRAIRNQRGRSATKQTGAKAKTASRFGLMRSAKGARGARAVSSRRSCRSGQSRATGSS
jgi:hypothetical protein